MLISHNFYYSESTFLAKLPQDDHKTINQLFEHLPETKPKKNSKKRKYGDSKNGHVSKKSSKNVCAIFDDDIEDDELITAADPETPDVNKNAAAAAGPLPDLVQFSPPKGFIESALSKPHDQASPVSMLEDTLKSVGSPFWKQIDDVIKGQGTAEKEVWVNLYRVCT